MSKSFKDTFCFSRADLSTEMLRSSFQFSLSWQEERNGEWTGRGEERLGQTPWPRHLRREPDSVGLGQAPRRHEKFKLLKSG